MPDRANVAYCYDGSFEGMLCCIFESFEKKERPVSIGPEGVGQLTLYPPRRVQTELSKARASPKSFRCILPIGGAQLLLLPRAEGAFGA